MRGARLVLTDNAGARAKMTASWLIQMGWRDVHVLVDGLEGQNLVAGPYRPRILGMPAVAPETVSVEELAALLDSGEAVVADLADSLAYYKGHIPGAWFVIRSRMPKNLEKLPAAPLLVLTSKHGELPRLAAGEEILITPMEQHSNIVPWQILCEQTGAVLRVAPITDAGELEIDEFEKLLGPRTRLVAVTHISNALGTVNPVAKLVELAHRHGAVVLIDGAQAAPHLPIDVTALGCDFYAITGHKMFGPTGVGALYGRYELLDDMEPYQGGGEMILSVSFEKTTYNHVPHKFEAGTPNIAGVIGMGAAVDYLNDIGLNRIGTYEQGLLAYATEAICRIPGVRLFGTAAHKAAVLSFTIGDVHPHDAGTILDQQGIAVRTGHHCAQPVMERFGVTATVRASIALYNTHAEIDRLAPAVATVREVFA